MSESHCFYANDLQGALCGAIYVDEELIRLLKTRFAEISSIPWERMDPEELDHFMNMIWNSQRNTFSGQNSENWTVRLPYSLIPPGHTGIQPRVVITPEDMMQVFQPSVERIADMVGEQISAINENRGKPPRVSLSCLSLSCPEAIANDTAAVHNPRWWLRSLPVLAHPLQ